MDIIKRFFSSPESGSVFIFGPRGTGKSTWIRKNCPDAVVFDLLKPEVYSEFLRAPERLRDYVLVRSDNSTIVLDEVQKVPEILSVVHELIEMKRGWKFILTGSSARKLKHSGADLLAGRAYLKTLHPFMAAELKEKFSLENALKFGMVPVISESDSPENAQKAYIGIYLKEEVLQEGIVRKLDQFSRFLEAMSFSQASVLTLTNIARDVSLHRKVVESYLQILEDLLLGFKLPVFTKRAKRKLSAHPKFYYFDCGIYRALRPKGPLDRPEEIDGHGLETLVAQHLRAYCDYANNEDKLFFWQTKSKHEVDFVVYGPQNFIAIEVKNTRQIRSQDLKSLNLFLQDYPESKALLLYRGNLPMQKGGISCLPVEPFLKNLHPKRPIPCPISNS